MTREPKHEHEHDDAGPLGGSLPLIVLAAGAGAQQHAAPMAMTDEDMIKSAMAAAPEAVAAGAAIVALEADGNMRTLRRGSNGFTCLPDNPNSPGPDPMCGDANAMEWAAAWIEPGHPPALGRRERAPLSARRHLPRGRQPRARPHDARNFALLRRSPSTLSPGPQRSNQPDAAGARIRLERRATCSRSSPTRLMRGPCARPDLDCVVRFYDRTRSTRRRSSRAYARRASRSISG